MKLTDTLYLARAGRYSSPKNTNDRLPIVYGDLTDGNEGIWPLPCIDTTNFVYCYAAHAVLSVANGNSISIYADGVLVDPANYTFNQSNNYESQGIIATVTFTSDQESKTISARGKGKDSGGILLDNIIDILEDFLRIECGFDLSIFEATAKSTARAKCEGQIYKAAGVINGDIEVWQQIIQMMGSFLGSAWLNGQGQLVLHIDDGN